MTISMTPTGKALREHIDSLIGSRRTEPDDDSRWRVNYGRYQVVTVDLIAYVAKELVFKRWKKKLACKWAADTMRGGIQNWASQNGMSPIAMGCLSAYKIGTHVVFAGGHRFNWFVANDQKLYVIDALFVSNPRQSRWLYPVTDQDDEFFDLVA